MLEISWLVGAFLCAFTYCYIFNNLINNEKIEISKTMIFLIILFSLINFELYKFNLNAIRPFIVHFFLFFLLYFTYKCSIVKTILGLVYSVMMVLISELLYDLIANFVFGVVISDIVKNNLIYFLSNIVIFLFAIILSKIKIFKKFFSGIVSWYYKKNRINTVVLFILFFSIVTFILYNNFLNGMPSSILWLTNLFCIGVMVFVIGYFKEKANNNRIITEYDHLLKYVNKYERLIEDKSKRQHEYKNQLVLIKGMISKTNKKAIEYIDSLYEEEKDDSNLEMLKKLQYLPSGGLKGLIYYKLEDMKDKKINVFVDISPKVKNVKVNKKLDSNLKDISKVIGVYLDNAIEASVKSKEKYIVLEIYLEKNEWVFSLSNTYKGEINLNRIDNEGYTTKGSGKGYGLSLAKDIIDHNKDLRQERELTGIYYTQRLYMKK